MSIDNSTYCTTAVSVEPSNHVSPAGARACMWLAISGRRTLWNRKSGGAPNRKARRLFARLLPFLLRQQPAQKSNRAPALKKPLQFNRNSSAGRVVARRSVRRRRSQRSGRHVDRAPGRSRGGSRGARPAKRAVEKGSARHDPDASWPRGPNFQCKPGNLRFAVSHSRLKNDFMYMYVDIPF